MTRLPPPANLSAGASSALGGTPAGDSGQDSAPDIPDAIDLHNDAIKTAARDLKLIAFDCDGVLWVGSGALDGAAEIIRWLKSSGIVAVALTNNASLNRESYAVKAENLGIPLSANDFYCTSYLIEKIVAESYRGKKVLVLGSAELLEAAKNAGANAEPGEKSVAELKSKDFREIKFDAVIAGLDVGLSYAELCHAVTAIQNGANLIATNPDYTFPMQGGYLWPGNGAFVELIERVSGAKADVIGKPSPRLLNLAMTERGVKPAETLVVGDRLSTDIACGIVAGAFTCLVMTGVAGGYFDDAKPVVPDMTAKDLTELLKWLKEVFSEGAGPTGANVDG